MLQSFFPFRSISRWKLEKKKAAKTLPPPRKEPMEKEPVQKVPDIRLLQPQVNKVSLAVASASSARAPLGSGDEY